MAEQKSKYKILLADCNAELRKIISENLNKENCFEICGESGDGHETLDLVRKHLPDVLVMDVVLPTLDGFALIENILKAGS